MALHVTHVAHSPLPVAETSSRRATAASVATGQAATKSATATLATRATASFDSLVASSASSERATAAVTTATARRSGATATSAAASSTASSGTSASSSSTSSASTATSGASDFELLFGGSSYNATNPMIAKPIAASTPDTATVPTAQSVFGDDVWMTDPIGLNPTGTTFEYNPIYFATPSTAQKVAQMVGGTVVIADQFCAPGTGAFPQQQPNYMVKMPNGALVNPGLVASFYTFGFSQSQVNTMVAQEVANTAPPSQET